AGGGVWGGGGGGGGKGRRGGGGRGRWGPRPPPPPPQAAWAPSTWVAAPLVSPMTTREPPLGSLPVRGPGRMPHASPPGLTRGSIVFREDFLRRGWIAGSSPAMTGGDPFRHPRA